MPPVIELTHINKSFYQRNWRTFFLGKPPCVQALKDVSLTVEAGEIMGLLGPNGAGKTTLIKTMATLISADTGEGLIAGFDLATQPNLIRQRIGLVSSNERTFYWRLSGRDNLDFFASLYDLGGISKEKRIAEVLELVGLLDKADFRFGTYSAGQRQRLAIARALLAKPDILFLDEATSSLDPVAARKLIRFTHDVLVGEQKKTIIWCTHNLKEAEEVCDRLTVIHQGQIVKSGSLAEMKNLFSKELSYKLKLSHLPENVKKLPARIATYSSSTQTGLEITVTIAERDVPGLLSDLVQAGVNIYECRKEEVPLEEIFAQLVSNSNHTKQLH